MSTVDETTHRRVSDFIFHECQLADESRWDEWEALLADDMHYWVPVAGADADPDRDVSIINDNRSRLRTRLKQLKTGTRHSQAPLSVMRRMLSNMVILLADDGLTEVEANFVIYEYQTQSMMALNTWPGRVRYRLRASGESFEIVQKRVDLIMASGNLPSMAFIV